MIKFELVQPNKHSTSDLPQPKNLQFLSRKNHPKSLDIIKEGDWRIK